MYRDDIARYAPGLEALTMEEHKALQEFTIIWTLFEAQVLDTNASARKIKEKVLAWSNEGALADKWFENNLQYFKNRYVENGNLNYRFEHLHLRRSDEPDLVKGVLLGKITDSKDELIACLIIVLRFRNNFFHGIKWAYGLKEQESNFSQSCELLKNCIERFANYY